MLFHYISQFQICIGIPSLMLFFFICAKYVYRANERLSDDDPKKRNYHPRAVLLAPFTWPLFILGWISLFILKALAYGIFLILFTIALVGFRKPFLFVWLNKIITKIGRMLLEANTFLIRIFFGEQAENAQPA